MVSRAISWMSTKVVVELSPETTTRPVFTSVSQATRPVGSSAMTASRTPSEIWSATLSGWPSVTDSEVNRYSFSERFVLIGWAATPRFGKRGEFGSGNLSASFFAVTLLAAVVVDDQRDALEPVPLPEPILDEEAVVAREPGAVVHLDREAWRADVVL